MLKFKEGADLAVSFENLKLIQSKKSNLHSISLYGHKTLGKILVMDNEVQHVESWAPLYHEMIVHLPIAFIPKVKNVLILGGGSLFAAYETLKYSSINSVVLIDHDKTIIDIIERNYPHGEKVLGDKRFNLIINDAFEDIKLGNSKYDLIINDSIDLSKKYRHLKISLLELLGKKLEINGICSDVIYRHIFESKTTLETIKLLKKKFNSLFSLITVPEYPGIFHILCLWSNTNKNILNKTMVNHIQKKSLRKIELPYLYYNPNFLNFYCYLPKYINKILDRKTL